MSPANRVEPAASQRRAVAFFDGQNLFHAAREAFGYRYPNYDPIALAHAICAGKGWMPTQVRFYTGVPDRNDNAFWCQFWDAKLAALGTRPNVHVYRRKLRYQVRTFELPDGSFHSERIGHEKGIDVRIALDIVRLAETRQFDVGLIFSQDQDLSEVADEIRLIAGLQKRWIKLASAFPAGAGSHNKRGINGTDWIPIEKSQYECCLDPTDYRNPTV